MAENNIRTMDFIEKDFWNRAVYRCLEDNQLYKDNSDTPLYHDLHTCGNALDGEPNRRIDEKYEIRFTEGSEPTGEEENPHYRLLSRLRQDCDYYLGYGNRSPRRLWAGTEKAQIEKMKELYNGFAEDKKPEWISYEEILDYEKAMVTVL